MIKKFDAIVVGAGLGGLSAAATLARKGYKVQLLDCHDKVGGFATNYRRGKYRMEAGIHMLSGPTPGSWIAEVFEFLEISQNVPFVHIENFYECRVEDRKFVVPGNLKVAHDSLAKDFPHEQEGITRFFKSMVEVSQHFEEFCQREPFIPATHPMFRLLFPKADKYWKISVGSFLDGIITDPYLKITLLANVTFYHDNPYELSLIQYMISQLAYFLGGCFFIEGGSQNFSNYLRKTVESAGGEVKTLREVFKFETQGGRITKVHSRKVVGELEEYCSEADVVFVNAPLPNVAEWLEDNSEWAEKEKTKSEHGLSVSSTTLNMGLTQPLRNFGNTEYMTLFVDGKKNQLDVNAYHGALGVLDYNIVPTKLCPEGRFMCEAIYIDDMARWDLISAEEYPRYKELVTQHVLGKMENYYPGIKKSLDFVEIGTPRTNSRYVRTPRGVIYGYHPSPKAIEARSDSLHKWSGARDKVFENLFYCSAWSFLPGFLGAIAAGYKAVVEAERLGTLPKPRLNG